MESLFKYIFALIVGVMFMLFFIGFAYNYIAGEQKLEGTLQASTFDDQLTILGVTEDSFNTYNLGVQTGISFDQGTIKSGKGISRKSSSIVYSPVNLNGKSLMIWTKKWKLPFAIDNFFYITNSAHKQAFIYDETSKEFVEELGADFPRPFNAATFEASRFKEQFAQVQKSYSGFTNVRFAYFTTNKPDAQILSRIQAMSNAEAIVIYSGMEDWESGTVTFGGDEAGYAGIPMMIGAIFAEDFSNYQFNLEKKAIPKLIEITQIYIQKAEFMASAYPGCEYQNIGQLLNSYVDSAKQAEVSALFESADNLNEWNKDNFGSECPEVF